uniref:YqgF/RNase H-like domain-containing protein n=1 Tax=Kalanchoe fedtschenkoi TaxID=63787 RepID=A0A7N0VHM6_KALFE
MMMKYVKPAALFRELVSPRKGRFVGLDVGDKYVGLAVSELDNKIATPFSVLLRKKSNIADIATDFQTMIKKLSLVGLVVGYPFHRQKSSPDAVQVKIFIENLAQTQKLEGVKYTYWDESFTSKGVDLLINSVEMHPLEYKTAVDKFAAVKILQEYLDQMNRKSVIQT